MMEGSQSEESVDSAPNSVDSAPNYEQEDASDEVGEEYTDMDSLGDDHYTQTAGIERSYSAELADVLDAAAAVLGDDNSHVIQVVISLAGFWALNSLSDGCIDMYSSVVV